MHVVSVLKASALALFASVLTLDMCAMISSG
jgi:hypothetical protein